MIPTVFNYPDLKVGVIKTATYMDFSPIYELFRIKPGIDDQLSSLKKSL